MKPILIAILLLWLGINASYAQNYTVKGRVADTVEKANLANTIITVITAKDSILQAYTRVGSDGTFSINNLNKGKYILLAIYPGYADYEEHFMLDSASNTYDAGRLDMILRANLLKGVIIKGEVAAIKIKGDTTEFNAKAFKIGPNDKVEDLIKQFPGMQVDQKGNITFQGKAIKNVLVDGEEFFGDDPTLVTKNLRADMVDKAQVYDKKSDQATFTGIDDGVKTPTLNIKLKADKKNGYFGKVDATIGTQKYYQEQLMFNRFKGNQKFSVYGNTGNTGTVGLGWEDNAKYGGGGFQFGDQGSLYVSSSHDDLDSYDGKYNNQGIPLARSGGAHYDTKWNADKESINTNYKIGMLNVDGTRNTQSQSNFRDGIYRTLKTNDDQTFKNHIFRQKLDLTYQVKLDTSSNLKFYIDGTDKHSTTLTTDNSATIRQDSLGINNSRQTDYDRKVNNAVDSKIFNTTLYYTKKFKKPRRTFSAAIGEAYQEDNAKGTLVYTTNYYNTSDVLNNTVHTDQKKINDNKSSAFNTLITYTEPVTKHTALVLTYGLNISNSSSDRQSYKRPDSLSAAPGPLDHYNILVPSLSNDFKLNQLSNKGGVHFNYKKNKLGINLGTDVANVDFKQIDRVTDNMLNRHFANWNPTANIQYQYSTQGNVSLNYYGYTIQPGVQQLQPVKDNTNPLFTPIGNQQLKPSFSNNYYLNYYSYKVLTNQFIGINGSYSSTVNPIIDSVTMDAAGNSSSKFINLKTHQTTNFNLSVNYSIKFKPLDMNTGINASASGSNYYDYNNYNDRVNPAQLNKTSTNTYTIQAQLIKSVDKKYDFGLFAGPSYTLNTSSLQKNTNNNGYGFNGNWWLLITLPRHFGIGTWGFYKYSAATQSFSQDYRQTNFNAYVFRKFLKDESIKVMVQGLDLFNQNNGFDRTGTGSSFSQSRYTTIKRYFTLSVTWDFSKMGGGALKK